MALTHERNATNETMPRHIWIDAIERAAIERGVSAEWLREPLQRKRLNIAYDMGEPAWMELDAVCLFWRGVQLAAIEEQDGMSHIRAAARKSR